VKSKGYSDAYYYLTPDRAVGGGYLNYQTLVSLLNRYYMGLKAMKACYN